QRRDQKDHRRDRGQAGEEVSRPGRPEDGLAPAAAEGDPHAPALTGLQQHDQDQKQTDRDVNDREESNHDVESDFLPACMRRTKDSATNDAPPTSPPSTSSSAISALTLSGFMLPP